MTAISGKRVHNSVVGGCCQCRGYVDLRTRRFNFKVLGVLVAYMGIQYIYTNGPKVYF